MHVMSQSILIHHLHTHMLYVTNAKVVHKHGYSIRSMQVVRGHWARQAAAVAAATGPQHTTYERTTLAGQILWKLL